jgi:flagellar basal body rod protein FlgC
MEVSFDPSSPQAQAAGKLTVTTVFLLTAMTLM